MIREHLLQKRAAADPLFRLRDGLVARASPVNAVNAVNAVSEAGA